MKWMDNSGRWTVMCSDDSVHQFDQSHSNYDALVECIKDDDECLFSELIDISTDINEWGDGEIEVVDGVIRCNGFSLNAVLSERMLRMRQEGFDTTAMSNFVKKLVSNPSKRSIDQLYLFAEHKDIPISEDGCLITWKYVSVHQGDSFVDCCGRTVSEGDFVDSHTRKIRNNVGDINSMPRGMVDDDPNSPCSTGFHVGSIGYVGNHPYKVVCKVDPADIVSVPADANCQKMRVCKYEVIAEFRGVPETSVSNYDEYDEYEDEDEDDEYIDW